MILTFPMWVGLIVFGLIAAYLIGTMITFMALAWRDELPEPGEQWYTTCIIGSIGWMAVIATILVIALIGLSEFIAVLAS